VVARSRAVFVVLRDLRTGEVVRTFDAGGRHQTYAAAVSPDGRTLATGGWEGSVHLWDLASGEHLTRIPAHRHGIMKIEFSPDGRLLATASQDRLSVLISMEKGHERRSLRHKKEVFGVAFSPCGRWLATGEESAVRVWDVATATERFKCPVRSREVRFSPDGRRLAAGTWGPILLFDASAWES
jgi:WD40 repeat protein